MSTPQDSKKDTTEALIKVKALHFIRPAVCKAYNLHHSTLSHHLKAGNVEHPAVIECLRMSEHWHLYAPGLAKRGAHFQETNKENRGKHLKKSA